jgi:hypothetical protein
MVFHNLTAARLLGNYATITDTSNSFTTNTITDVQYNLKRLGISDSAIFTVSINPTSDNIQSVGEPNSHENISILDIANMVSLKTNAKIVVKPSNDPRSYRINSDKLLATGFKPSSSVENAIKEMIDLYRDGELKDLDKNYNLKWMEKHKLYNLD